MFLGDGEYWICSAGDPRFLGKYTSGNEMDGVSTFLNDNGMAIFRSKKFWYLGNIESWPPVTYYRCVEIEDCNAALDSPPTPGKWTTNKKFGKDPIPVVQFIPCEQENDEL